MCIKHICGTSVHGEFWEFVFTFLPGQILYMEYPFGHLKDRSYTAQLSSKIRRLEAGFGLNNRLMILVFMKDIPVLALKVNLRRWVYFRALCRGHALICHFFYLAIPYGKAKYFCFTFIQLQNSEFISVQINMKHVSQVLVDYIVGSRIKETSKVP